jgi:hypothetical protein
MIEVGVQDRCAAKASVRMACVFQQVGLAGILVDLLVIFSLLNATPM